MSRWLTQAAQIFARREQPSVVQPFKLQCTCGRVKQGYRQPHYQRWDCEDCGEAVLILPQNPYPQPLPPASQSPQPIPPTNQKITIEPDDLEPLIVDEADEALWITTFEDSPPSTFGSPSASIPTSAPPPAEAPPSVAELEKRRPAGLFSPLKLIVLAIGVVIALTLWYVWRDRQMEQAQQDLKQARKSAEVALGEGDLFAAKQELGRASAALDVLGHEDADAQWDRQRYREVRAGTHLLNDSLYEVLDRIDRDLQSGGGAGWQKEFKDVHGGRWIVVETFVFQVNDGKKSRYVVEYPAVVGERAVLLEADCRVFDKLSIGGEPRPVIFAAQIESCRLMPGPPSSYLVKLNPKTAVLWADWRTYRALGFQPDELRDEPAIKALLAEQAEAIGLESEEVKLAEKSR